MNPQNHQILHNFGFAEETVGRDGPVDGGGMFGGSFLYPPNQRRLLS